MSNNKAAIVAIVGRANVGKSSLFNAALGRREAVTAAEPGTTRDSLTAKSSWAGKDFWLVDTAGLKSAEDEFELSIQAQIAQAAELADAIIVVVDAKTTITEEDRRVATLALKTGKPVTLAVNKADTNKKVDSEAWRGLGIKSIVLTSAVHKTGLDELFTSVATDLPKTTITQDSNRIKIALLGRPNVGKSSLFNTLAAKQQALVSDRAGTTRDVNRVVVKYHTREIELMDTAGIRRSGKIGQGVEQFSVLRSIAAIEEADVCLLLIDTIEPRVHLDQKIAGMIREAGKGLILVVTKWDTVADRADKRTDIMPSLKADYVFVPWAPVVFTSATTGENVAKLFDLALEIHANRQLRVKTTELNHWLSNATQHHPPAGLKNRQPKLRYIVQEDDQDLPSFKIFGKDLKYLHWSYRRYLDRTFRENWPLPGTPIKFWFIEKNKE